MSVETKASRKPRWAWGLSLLLVGLVAAKSAWDILVYRALGEAVMSSVPPPGGMPPPGWLDGLAGRPDLTDLLRQDWTLALIALAIIWLLVCIQKAAQS